MSDITQVVTVTTKETVDVICDVCGTLAGSASPDDWHRFSSCHSGWGNDSVDSFEWFDVCSVECFLTQVGRQVALLEGYSGAEISAMTVGFAKKLLTAYSARQCTGIR